MKYLKTGAILGLASATLLAVGLEGKAYVQSRTSIQPETKTTILAGYHDRYGNYWWGDGSIEPCYNYSAGYYC
jgi:prepilin-type processing-associated H-X9-DG protein